MRSIEINPIKGDPDNPIESQKQEAETIDAIPKDFSEEELKNLNQALDQFDFRNEETDYIVHNEETDYIVHRNPRLAFLLINNPEIAQNIANDWMGSRRTCQELSVWIEQGLINKNDLAAALIVMNKIEAERLPSEAVEIAAKKGLLHNIKELFQIKSGGEELDESIIKEIKKEYVKFCRESEFEPKAMDRLTEFVEHIHKVGPEAVFLALRSATNLSYIIKEAYQEGYQEKPPKIFFIDVSHIKNITDQSTPFFQEEVRKTAEKLAHLSELPSIVVADEVFADCRTTRQIENIINVAAATLNKVVTVHKLSPKLEEEIFDAPTLFTRRWTKEDLSSLQNKIGQEVKYQRPAHRFSTKNFKESFLKEDYRLDSSYYAKHGFPEKLSELSSFLRARYGGIGKTVGRRIKEEQEKALLRD
ncbi:MAG: hypothetical protein AAB723_02170 [Patescibacteria group bacterium]